MHNINIIGSDDPIIAQIGAAAGLRGDTLVIVVDAGLSGAGWVEAVREVVTAEEWAQIAAARGCPGPPLAHTG